LLTALPGQSHVTFTTTSAPIDDTDGQRPADHMGGRRISAGWVSIRPAIPDNDGFTDPAGYTRTHGSQFTANWNPIDTDGDGLADAWEMRYFGTLDYGPDGSFDGMTGRSAAVFSSKTCAAVFLSPDGERRPTRMVQRGHGITFGDSPRILRWCVNRADISANGLL